ncbi:MAG: biopolymer transporter ExbD [Marinobacter sp.]|uniref:ExbD/TolR family protein n=1 Tax=Marinobacter sp. TaxID=50741 RepID=UPI00299E48FF|nr:biopolymer transporter ExbD [Marinobacter sp.]MDX1633684.1 biopolymer transporter ExbD [Marinobacter sp.]
MQLVEPRPARPMPIRITPLIDVVFILLVFFMLTTRLLPIDELSLANSSRQGTSTGDPLPALQLQAGGDVRWRDQSWRLPELTRALTAEGIRRVNLAASGDASLADFTTTLGALTQAGIEPRWQRDSAGPEVR